MDNEMKRFLKEELKKEANQILQEVEKDPEVKGIEAPPELHDRLFAQIREYEQKRTYENLPEEYKELVDLGRVYKRKRKYKKYLILAAAMVLALAIGVTSFGGPERIFKEIKWAIGGREQVNVDSDGDKIVAPDDSSEEEAYQKIKDELGFDPVRMNYLPESLWFEESMIDKELKIGQMNYCGKDKELLIYRVNVNSKQGSVGFDVEDEMLETATIYNGDISVEAKQYQIKATGVQKWILKFEYKGVQYFITVNNVEKAEIKRIVKNLFFF